MSFIIPPPFKIEFPEQLALSDSITGTRSGVAASEKAIGRVNQKIPQARFSKNWLTPYGWIHYGRIASNTGGMLHFNLETDKKWAILTLEIRVLDRRRVLDGRDFVFFSLGLMSLSPSQMQAQNQNEIARLLMDSHVTELHAFDSNNFNEKYMTLVVSPSKNRLTFFDCPDGMSVKILQEMVIQ
ncbi:conserved hypothetical protein [Vibrio crassostreae]|uniref:hypothetical protein n=1 Tax=Vibrio sp. L5-1 TaxID=2912254 RepID=UPI001F20EA75|nr:hypothetical protein [Vibrio sp. L5-1]CAK1951926.1 conserved hypothetical protein [Vibrio crassostreae]MCF7495848.1 hypothetical protein [Vibrio sp. L5-1]CAK1965934.1 conserved hypothetical protein [Vibrio crassostreae]CAK1967014.1 conserved hypothetical protein [Vibrio crassostreae]CAK2315631.1 conserved hypothetical protein [Vibrio crassostreae]